MGENLSGSYEFGPFRLVARERMLLRDGLAVALTPKAFDVLLTLVEHPGHLLEKEALLTKVWPDSIVEENNLADNISRLRKALGEGENGQKFIETVPKRGYRFVAPVRRVNTENATLIVEEKTGVHEVIEEKPPTVLSLPEGQRRFTQRFKSGLTTVLASGALIAGVAIGGHEFFKARRASDETRPSFLGMQVRRFTASGNVLAAEISPDGKYIATVLDEGGLQSLWLRQMAANTSSVRLIAPALVEYVGLTFSKDSNFIYYVSWVRNQSDAELHQLPVLGGTPRKIPIVVIDTPISFSPAGDRFAYVSSRRRGDFLNVADVDGGGEQILVKRDKPGFFATWPGGPAWSPDGNFIAYAGSGTTADDIEQMRVFVANVASQAERQLSVQSWRDIGRVAWLSDGTGLVISARQEKDAPRQVWFVSYPDGAARKITNDLHDYESLSPSGDARTLAAVLRQSSFSVAVIPHGGVKQANPDLSRPIFSEVGRGIARLAWTSDNHLLYCTRASGNWDIWMMNKDNSERRQLTFDEHNDLYPAISADGRHIFFASDRAGAFNIWRMEIDGSQPTQLTRGIDQTLPEVTPDGQWVLYQQNLDLGDPNIWRVPATGGEAQPLTTSFTLPQRPDVSPDGRLLAYVNLDKGTWGLTICSLESGEAVRTFTLPSTIASRYFRWTPDGQALAYIVNEKDASNIWLQPLSGTSPSRLTYFKTEHLLAFAWSPDGQWLGTIRQASTSDVVLLSNFK